MANLQKFNATIPILDKTRIIENSKSNIDIQKNIWLASFIRKIEKSQVHSLYLQRILGNKYRYHIDTLVNLGLIKRYDNYFADFGSGYCKTVEYTGTDTPLVLYRIENKSLNKRIFNHYRKEYKALTNTGLRSQKYVDNGISIEVSNALQSLVGDHNINCAKCNAQYTLEDVYKTIQDLETSSVIQCNSLRHKILQIALFDRQSMVSSSEKTGRTYHKVNGMNKTTRKSFVDAKNSMPLVEADISQSHIFLIALKSNDDKLLQAVIDDDLYNIVKGNHLRSEAKEEVFKFVNCPFDQKNFARAIFSKEFPKSFNWIVNYSKVHSSKGDYGITNVLSREEFQLIHESMRRMHEKGVECVSIHDSISSTQPQLAAHVMHDVWFGTYGVSPVVKYG